MRDRILVISNPVSGKGRAKRLSRALLDQLRKLGISADLRETARAGDAQRIAATAGDYEVVACIGGDGTMNEGLNGLPDGVLLAMIPSGTANVMAKELRMPRNAKGLARVLAEGREFQWDMGVDRVNGRRFLLFAGVGYDAHVVHAFHAIRKGTIRMSQYIYWGLKCLFDYKVPRIRVEVDGRVVAEEAAWVLVSNVAAYGGPLAFTPNGRPDSGVFEVMILHSPKLRDTPRLYFGALYNFLTRRRYPFGGVEYLPARRVRLSSPDRVPMQFDGDPGGHLPADLEILPGSVRVLGPSNQPG